MIIGPATPPCCHDCGSTIDVTFIESIDHYLCDDCRDDD